MFVWFSPGSAAQIHAHDELQAQRVAAAAAARRRRSRIRKAFVMGGALTGVSLVLAAACNGASKQQRPEAAAAAPRLPAAGRDVADWCFMLVATRVALAAARRLK